jgi:glutaredoxin
MKQIKILLIMAVLAVSSTALAAQLYRWVDDKGNVEWRDTPPPASAKKVEQRRVGGSTIETSTLPYSVQVAMKNFPVTLWVTNCGAACDQAKAHLARRGVPYSEKDPQADVDAFQKLTGSNEVPVMYVGSTQIKGYLASQYDAALDSAGYPRTAPPGSKPAAKPAASAKADTPASRETPAAQPGATGGAPAVRLFTHPQCGVPCEEAKTLLNGRGISYQEVAAVNPEALAELQKLSGGVNVPTLVVGQSVTTGWADTNFNKALDDAGYRR